MKLIPTLSIVTVSAFLIGTVDAKPRHRIACKVQKSKVNTPWEKRADTNDNGRVSPSERKAVQEKRVVDTKREEHIDKNDDGVIGRLEARRAWHKRRVTSRNN